MRYRLALTLAVASVAGTSIVFSTPGAAHHSFSAEFDSSRPVAVEGTITKVRIVNPHGWLYVDQTNADGTTTNWGFEFGSPTTLVRTNLSREDLRPGSHIKIEGFRARNTGPFAYAQTVQLSSGRTVQVGGAPDAPGTRRER